MWRSERSVLPVQRPRTRLASGDGDEGVGQDDSLQPRVESSVKLRGSRKSVDGIKGNNPFLDFGRPGFPVSGKDAGITSRTDGVERSQNGSTTSRQRNEGRGGKCMRRTNGSA
jgi:hypothetical protein